MSTIEVLVENTIDEGVCKSLTTIPGISSSLVALIMVLMAVALRKSVSTVVFVILVLCALSCLSTGISNYFTKCKPEKKK